MKSESHSFDQSGGASTAKDKSPIALADNVAQCDEEHTETEESMEKHAISCTNATMNMNGHIPVGAAKQGFGLA